MAKKKVKFEDDEEISDQREYFLRGEDEEASDEKREHMREGKDEIDVYSKEGREELIEENEIEDWEEGFAEGAEGLGKKGHCINCKKAVDEAEEILAEVNSEEYLFCSEKCLKEFKKKHKRGE